MAGRVARLAAFLSFAASAGCFECRERCVPGAAAACACTDGRSGAQVCGGDGTFEACVCTGALDAGEGTDGSAGLDAGDAAVPCVVADPPIEICNGLDDDCDGKFDPDDCAPGLEAWYRFEDTQGLVVDSSGNGWDGTVLGAVARGAPGAVGSAIAFLGSTGDRVAVVGGPAVDASAGWTIEAWVGFSEPAGTPVLVKGAASGAPGSLDFQFLVATSMGGSSATGSWEACDVALCHLLPGGLWSPVDRFVHHAVSWDGVRLHAYLDGQEYVSQIESGAFFGLWDGDLSLGNSAVPLAVGWLGTLDEVKLWSVTRTAEEICGDAHGIYSAGPPPSCALP